MHMIDLDAFNATPLATEPYEHIVVPNFVKKSAVERAVEDFPSINQPGSFALNTLVYGPAFSTVIEEFRRPEVTEAFSEKFNVDLSGRPLMITARGWMQKKDGRIHTDTESKIITVLIYMNETWDHVGGRLRILRDGNNMNNYSSEVAPLAGTLLAFKRSDNSWHGHRPFIGQRRSIQLNWVTDKDFIEDQYSRHSISAAVKSIQRFFNE